MDCRTILAVLMIIIMNGLYGLAYYSYFNRFHELENASLEHKMDVERLEMHTAMLRYQIDDIRYFMDLQERKH